MKGSVNTLRAAAAALLLLAMGGSAYADSLVDEKAIPGKFSANVALTTEYYFRGISQSDDKPALQGGMDYEVDLAKTGVALYLGLWGSNVDFNDGNAGANLELDLYGGLRGKIADTPVSWDFGVIYYAYPGADSNLNYDFVELAASLGYDFGVASVTASINYSPDYTTGSGTAYYPKLAVDVPVPMIKGLSLGAYVAYQNIDREDTFGTRDYYEWNLSATYNVVGFDLSVAYSDTDISGDVDGKTSAVIFTIARSF